MRSNPGGSVLRPSDEVNRGRRWRWLDGGRTSWPCPVLMLFVPMLVVPMLVVPVLIVPVLSVPMRFGAVT